MIPAHRAARTKRVFVPLAMLAATGRVALHMRLGPSLFVFGIAEPDPISSAVAPSRT